VAVHIDTAINPVVAHSILGSALKKQIDWRWGIVTPSHLGNTMKMNSRALNIKLGM
jgi:hypothetical protein